MNSGWQISGWRTMAVGVLCTGLVGCSPPPDEEPPTVTVDGGGGDVAVDGESDAADGSDLEPIECEADESFEPWSKGETAFEDASESWGLPDIAPDGVRMSVTDLQGDGWPDLVVRRTGKTPNSFKEDGKRTVWVLENTGDGEFEDVTAESNLAKSRVSGSDEVGRPFDIAVWGDVDNDGDLDAYTGFNKTQPDGQLEDSAEIMLNEGDGTFKLGAIDNDIRRSGEFDSAAGATFVDYNRDGNLDLWVTQYSAGLQAALQDRLYRGNGDGTFEEVTEEMGLTTSAWTDEQKMNNARAHTRSWGSNACDLNGDGVPELLSASYGRAPNHLWRATTDGDEVSYENISVESGYAYDDGTDWTDNESARCHCKLHPEDAECEGVPDPTVIRCSSDDDVLRWNHATDREKYRLGGNSGTTLCADFNRDGQMDLLTNEIVHFDVGSSSDPSEILYNREGDKIRFERPGREQTGLTREHTVRAWNEGDITSGAIDFDNDGRTDIYIGSTDYPGTRGLLWHQTADGTFEKVPQSDGIEHPSSHGVALADFDRDGDVDLVAGHSRFRCSRGDHCYSTDKDHVRLFENKAGDTGNWLQVDLEGTKANRSAIGARVTVETESGSQIKEVDGGHGHYGLQNSQVLHFGLGKACKAKVTVRWPDQELTEQTVMLEAGSRYAWKQGESPSAEQ